VAAGILLYVASCPPVEAWHDKQRYGNTSAMVGHRPPPGPTPDGHFEVVDLKLLAPSPRPKWMQLLYAPVHFVEQYPPFAALLQQYRNWCEELFSSGS
jgi:hypothetical protein